MAVELQMLAWSIALGLVQIVIQSSMGTLQRGLKWNTGARDGVPKPLDGPAARAERALKNFLETFPLFAAAALAVVVAQKTSAHTAPGAQLYFWSRVAYVPAYVAGIAYVRTLIWGVSVAGLVMVLSALF